MLSEFSNTTTQAEFPSASAGGGAGNNVMAAAQAAQHSVTSISTSMNAITDKNCVLSDSEKLLRPPDTSSLAFDAAEELILLREDRDATSEALVETTNEDDIAQYLAAVDVVIDHLACGDARAARAEVAVQLAMVRFEEEFRHLMLRHAMTQDYMTFFSSLCDTVRASVEDDTSSLFSSRRETLSSIESDTASWVESMEDLDALPIDFDATTAHSMEADPVCPGAVDELRAIANRMARAGYVRELAKAYCDVRRDLLDEFLSTLGVEHLSVDEVQRIEWKHLNDKMKKWVREVRTIVPVLLTGERWFCDQVLAVSDKLREECFFESTKVCIMRILKFGDGMAMFTRSPEKLLRIIDMYEALEGMIPAVENLWLGSSGYCVIRDVQAILDRLGDAVRDTLSEFERMLQQETSRRVMLAGEVHPMTRYVMNYLRLLVVYGETLEVLLGNHSDDQNASQDQEHMEEGMTLLGRCLMKLMSYLEANLKEKSNLYEDAALGCIFVMNNYLYIVQKVKDSDLGKILGDGWIKGRRDKINHYSQSYLRISWAKVLSYLLESGSSGSEGGSGSGNSISRMSIKSKFKNFNMAFDENYRNQTCWNVPDPELRQELQVAISVNVVQAYRAFMGRYGVAVGKNPGKYVKYTPEDLENRISELFQGRPRPGSAKPL